MKQHKANPEYAAFENLLRTVISVSHSELKQRMETDKQERKRKRPKTSRASRESDKTD